MMKLSIKPILFIVSLCMTVVVSAADDNQYLLTEKTYKSLESAQILMADENYKEAETKLNALLKQVDSASYEQAIVQQTMGYLFSTQEDYKKASQYFQKALESNALPEKVSHDLTYNLAQLLLADEQYKKGISLLETWLKTDASPPNSAYVLMASANYRVKEYKKTIEYIRIAIKNDDSVNESWHQVALSAHLELKQYKSAIKVLETLLTSYPYKKRYWSQLSALYLQQNKEFSSLAVKMLAQRLELGDAKTLVNLANMYRYLHIPYKSAQLLTKGIEDGVIKADFDNLNKIADSWLSAREYQKAADVLQKVTALDDSGESDLKYGRVLFGMEQWQEAVTPLMRAIENLKGEKVGSALLLLGMVQFHLDDLAQAKKQFTKSVKFENERNQAGQWLRHVNRQLESEAKNES
ncbi:MAG: tetratricopeptide repeat protein [Proteobacteria bacterium]|nr:tetratricopeptide repeat protein [Pseudomonadota bacterium]